MDQRIKMKVLQQVEKHFAANEPLMLSVVFDFGELASVSIIPASTFIKVNEFGKITTSWRYGHFKAQVWLRELTKNLLIDAVKEKFAIIHQMQVDNLNEEVANLGKALIKIQSYL